MSDIAIQLKDLTVAYDRRPAVHHINVALKVGTLTAITGPNGAGKSTLLKAIAGILPVYEGSITFDAVKREQMAYFSQAADLQVDFPINVLQMVTSGFWQSSGGFKGISVLQREKACEAISNIGLRGYENRTLDTLSSGQFQRALFARLIVQDAQLILLDEPFTSLDSSTTEILLAIINKWHKENRTIICVLHDFEQIKAHFNDCLLIAREMIAFGKPHEVLSPENLFSARFFREIPSTAFQPVAL